MMPLRTLFLALALVTATCDLARAQGFRADDVPSWFTETFLDVREDVRDAARDGKRVLLYFGQDGCPYCRELMVTNFSQPRIAEKAQRSFLSIALNIWGDREVTWTDGKVRPEKELARFLRVQFTPTIIVLDEKGTPVVRINGYYPPHRFEAALDYAAQRMERRVDFASHMRTAAKDPASAVLHDEPFFMPAPHELARGRGARPLAVLFETPYCAACDELHRDALQRPEVRSLLSRFDVARLVLGDTAPVVTPRGAKSDVHAWGRALKVAYTPTLVLFDAVGNEVLRIEAYVRPFHLASALEYVASGAYRRQPSFQRYVQTRAEALRARGERIELWK